MGLVEVNGTTLYHEVRGQGPPFLMISAAVGDCGSYAPVADALADEFTVVTYDRRGHSRSPRPEHWTGTSVQEQADDAAELLQALDLTPAAAFGLSYSGEILTDLVLRRPEVLTGAVFHEPGFLHMISGADALGARIGASLDAGMARGGRPAALESFLRLVCGDQVIDGMDPALLDRCLTSAAVFFDVDAAGDEFRPTQEALGRVRVPCVVTAGAENAPPDALLHAFFEAAQWLADGLGVPVVEVPGAHVSYASHPEAYAAALRVVLRDFARDPSADVG